MAIKVTPLTETDIPAAIEIIQSAFAEDPYFQWVFESEQFNKERNSDSLAVRCLWGIKNAIFHVAREVADSDTDSDTIIESESFLSSKEGEEEEKKGKAPVIGVSCWLPPQPPSTPPSWYTWTQDWLLSCRQMLNNVRHWGRGGLRTNRYWIWKARQQDAQSQIWDDPRGYYFCNIVAVSPRWQGRGVGRKLFEAVTERADREGVRCYLESSRDVPNVSIYEKLGFEMRMEMECRDGGDVCMLYCMVREPKAGQ
ncbi:acetyltransferase, GNAT family [Aspergillus heteromorphus CBS 117.55]|uniref:Acetyltransferase, GNAT family n=1 Tax=Aspergillus heteromorphus CBS 117.55 TaxID=1448321 RepID=A0A317VU27_9EURO|nr:acetyltransferase, GNAT family [Aspergillus heteromorphus CBS 117.55]PWY77365.1 acetyltransferase, GNAT family [Aspergillus heteromorphus CBS 117.55]